VWETAGGEGVLAAAVIGVLAATSVLVAQPTSQAYIVVPRDRLADALKALAECGCFHPEPQRTAGEFSARIRHLRSELEAMEQRLRDMLQVAV